MKISSGISFGQILQESKQVRQGYIFIYFHFLSQHVRVFIANLGKIKVKGIYKSIFFCLELLLSFGEKKKKKGKGDGTRKEKRGKRRGKRGRESSSNIKQHTGGIIFLFAPGGRGKNIIFHWVWGKKEEKRKRGWEKGMGKGKRKGGRGEGKGEGNPQVILNVM